MTGEDLRALAALTFDLTPNEDDVWDQSDYHVAGLHPDVEEAIRHSIERVRARPLHNPTGLAVQGEPGVGKTHLLGWARAHVQAIGGYFFLVFGVSATTTFWDQTLDAFRGNLQRAADHEATQLSRLLEDLAERCRVPKRTRDAVTGTTAPTRPDLDNFVAAVRGVHRDVGVECQDTLRALILFASPRQTDQDIGLDYLSAVPLDSAHRQAWGFRAARKTPKRVISEVSWLLALSGPIVIAVDQIDPLLDELRTAPGLTGPPDGSLVRQVGHGLMDLHGCTRRTLTVVACLPESWELIKQHAVKSVRDRFREARQLQNIPNPAIGEAIIARRFAVDFGAVGFRPPYPTWPIHPSAFHDAPRYTARNLIRRVAGHVASCTRTGRVVELHGLDEPSVPVSALVDHRGSSCDVLMLL